MKSGWNTSTLGDVLAVLRNGVNCKQDKSGKGDKISRIESISDTSFDLGRVGYAELSERDKERYRLQEGDILFSHINSAVHVGKTAVFDNAEPVYHGVNLLLMRPKDVVTSAYLDHALKYLFQSGYWHSVCKQSVNQASVNQQDILRVQISYPKSLPEQRRIVGTLDEAFEGIATATATAEKNLHNARTLFESHIQSVFTQRGEGWVKNPLEGLGTIRTGKRDANHQVENGPYPFYTCAFGQFRSPTFSFDGPSIILPGNGANVGKVFFYDGKFEAYQRTYVVSELSAAINPRFLFFCFSAGWPGYIANKQFGSATNYIVVGDLKAFPVPTPPPSVQEATVESLESFSAETQRLESIYQQKLAALDALKKSLLHQAFTGQL